MTTSCQTIADVPGPGPDLTGWTLTWQDEFDSNEVDTTKWEVLTRKNNHNNEKQYYLPEQAAIEHGMLVITTTNQPYGGRDYRSARLFSWHMQTYGRVEVRAKVPTTKGIWPAIWMLPRGVKWPTGGEIDIMEHKGSKAHMVSSAYHFANDQGNHVYQNHRHVPDPRVAFPDSFHIYAVEWDPKQITFYVDGEEHLTVVGGYVSDTPMGVLLNTAVGGWFDGEPDERTVFPQKFYIDYVRVWKRSGPAPEPRLIEVPDSGLLFNGSFEERTNGWEFTGDAYHLPHIEARTPKFFAVEGHGSFATKLYNDGRVSQSGVTVAPGRSYELSVKVRVNSDDSIAGTHNSLTMSLCFFDAQGQSIEGYGAHATIVDGETKQDEFLTRRVMSPAPPNAATAEVMFEFHRPNKESGSVWIDQVALTPLDP